MKLIKRTNGFNLIQVGDQWVVNGGGVKEIFFDLDDAWEFFTEVLCSNTLISAA
jgi:hypothetical protein